MNNQSQTQLLDSLSKMITQFEKILPESISGEYFERVCRTAIMNNDSLKECDSKSLMNAFMQCAKDGLVPDGNEAFINAFKTKNKPTKTAQYMPMIDGVLKRVRMSGQVSFITAKVVRQNDNFDYYFDENGEHLFHRPTHDDAPITMVYAIARLKSGEVQVEIMTIADIEKVRASSRTFTNDKYGSSPWAKWFDQMSLKSVLGRLAKRLPKSSDLVIPKDDDEDVLESRFNSATEVQPQGFIDVPKSQPLGIDAAIGTQPMDEFGQNFTNPEELFNEQNN